jgi:2-amino-4-hydroxy-6-hydroxymethyldihydropteridine diphosphokinase
MQTSVFLGLGANIQNPYQNLVQAIELLKNNPHIENLQTAKLYQTSPVGGIEQEDFLNSCCSFKTSLSCQDLISFSKEIEKQLGKGPKEKMGPRPVDIDILHYGNETLFTPELMIPHPHWHERLFVLIPLSELTNSWNIQNLIKIAQKKHPEDTVYPYSEDSFPWERIRSSSFLT